MFKNKKIFLHSAINEAFLEIVPIKNNIPEWYKKTKRFAIGNTRPSFANDNPSFKLCQSFLDTFLTGYSIPLVSDIMVSQTEDGPKIEWRSEVQILSKRDVGINELLPIPAGHSEEHFVWNLQHSIKIPKGYSLVLTHPLNRFDLPFTTLTGIIDGEFYLYGGNLPVFFNKNFEGIIKQGTPIAQVFFIKQENWENKKDSSILKYADINLLKSYLKIFGWYKDTIWQKKEYN
jgi:hypothetical protein